MTVLWMGTEPESFMKDSYTTSATDKGSLKMKGKEELFDLNNAGKVYQCKMKINKDDPRLVLFQEAGTEILRVG